MKTNDSNYKNVLKSNIILFLSYGILTGFIFSIIIIFIKYALSDITNLFLSITLSLICSILIYCLLHFVCISSNIETFKKISLYPKNIPEFTKKMNLFFILCVIFSVVICIGYLMLDNFIFLNAVNHIHNKYDFISQDLANNISNQIMIEYHNSFLSKVSSTIIIELSLVITFFSLIPYQKKLLKKYNKAQN